MSVVEHALLSLAGFSALQVRKEEADEVRKMLEAFRDEVNEEKVLRRLSRKRAASEGWAPRRHHWLLLGDVNRPFELISYTNALGMKHGFVGFNGDRHVNVCRFMVLRVWTDSTTLMKVLSHGLDAQKFLPGGEPPVHKCQGRRCSTVA